jgi:hypothetical protein
MHSKQRAAQHIDAHNSTVLVFAVALGLGATSPPALAPLPPPYGIYKSRASDFERLYRLGYHHEPRDFWEQQRAYESIDQAINAARTLNSARQLKRLRPLDTGLIYARLGYITFEPDEEEQP